MDLTLITTIDELMKTDKINGFSHQHLFKTQPFLFYFLILIFILCQMINEYKKEENFSSFLTHLIDSL